MDKKKNVKFVRYGSSFILLIAALSLFSNYGYANNSTLIERIDMLQQQNSPLKGRVVDKDGIPLIGVNIVVDSATGTITDVDGNFSVNVLAPVELKVSYIGYITQNVIVKNTDKELHIVLIEDAQTLEEVVVVGYGSQKKVTVTGAVASVQTAELTQNSAANLSTALAGRLPGLTALQTSGQPGVDDVAIYLRGVSTTNGQSPLILIDGVPREDIGMLDPNEIQSVSILKDASATAVFGVRGANGVIMVTTRRGEAGKSQLSVSVNYSLQRFITTPTRVHSWEFAELRNQAFLNDGTSADNLPFTDYMIDMYRNGKDRVFYPDRDVQSEFFRKWAPQTKVNINLSGGNDKLTYFLNAAYMGQGGQLKTESTERLSYDPAFSNDRYNFRANVDYKIAKNLKLSLNLASYLEKVNSPQTKDLFGSNTSTTSMVAQSMSYIWSIPSTQPGSLTAEGYTLEDGTPVPGGEVIAQPGTGGRNIYGDLNRRGYRQQTNSNLNSSVTLDWGLDFITKGLSTKIMAAFDTKSRTIRQGVRLYDQYDVHVATTPDDRCYYTEIQSNQNDALNLSKTASTNYYLNLQYSINYERDFGLHRVTGMALVQRDSWQQYAADLPYNMLGISARATYAYNMKYLMEVNLGYNGSEQFAKKKRFGFFPAFSAGWVVSNERFLEKNKTITNLKLRASYGKVGNDQLGSNRFLYLDDIQMASGVIPSLGRGQSISINKKGNPDVGWEIAYKQNYGVDIQLFNELSFSFDYFRERREDILIQRSTVPELQGLPLSALPKVNMGMVHNSGFELEVGYNRKLNKDFSFGVKGNFSYNKNKIDYIDETCLPEEYAYPYRKTGYSIGQIFGYKIDCSNGNGYINTVEELEWAKKAYKIGTPRMGDLLYKDVNGDGDIDPEDISPIKYSNIPRITYGFSGNLSWRNLDFSFLFSGVAKVSKYYSNFGVTEIGLVGFYTGYHLNAWTAERYNSGRKIEYPALSANTTTSMTANDFFVMDRSFLRLKNIELGYTLPKLLLEKIKIQKLRIYVSGNNLLTFKKMKLNSIDPEQSSETAYPVTKMVSFGANVTF